jgi:hypothetical protein
MMISLAFGLGFDSCENSPETNGPAASNSQVASPAPSQAAAQNSSGTAKSNSDQRPNRAEVEQQRKDAEQQVEKTLDKEAIATIEDTRNAVKAIEKGKTGEALAAIERATGKVNILLARNPAAALIPVAYDVDVIDNAPLDLEAIRGRAKTATAAVNDKDFPRARFLLDMMTSEIRTRIYHLPLATYPDALKEAAQLLDQKKTREASNTLMLALNALAVVNQVQPLPVFLAKLDIDEAQTLREKDKPQAQKLLGDARYQLDRANELGYAARDPEYATLSKAISNLETQLKGGSDTASAFSKLKDQVAAFFKKVSESVRRV